MSAAGEALQMLPPRVARFWLAMEPVQEADWMRSGRSRAMWALRRMSVKVVLAPMAMALGETWMKRSSLRWLMERRDFWVRRPAARATMSSVPPAMGVWRPGFSARRSRASAKGGGGGEGVLGGVSVHGLSCQLSVVSSQFETGT